ncbi:MAG TPA: CapA family protein [Lysobacter sp.]|nr:CapA family protein [Lysobacter sp.]
MSVPQPRAPLRLLLGGDVMLGRGVAPVLEALGPAYPLEALSRLIADADLFFVNLECALSARQQRFAGAAKAFYFRAGPDAVRALTAAGVDLVTLANNHVLDADVAGLTDTLAILAQHGIASVGAGADLAAASEVRAMECRGWRLGVLAVCDHQADFAAAQDRPGIHYLDLEDARSRRRLVERVRAEAPRFDHLVVSLHWLPNWVPSIPPLYRRLAGELVDAGARVLWGHSPHHILGTQWWPRAVALYSTGDLIDDYALDLHFRNDRQLLYLLELGEGRVARVIAYPLGLRFGRAEPADADVRRWIEAWLRDACAALGSEVIASGQAFEIRRRSPRGNP